MGADHLDELGHVLSGDLAEPGEGFETPEELGFWGWGAQELEDSHRQFYGDVVEHLRDTT